MSGVFNSARILTVLFHVVLGQGGCELTATGFDKVDANGIYRSSGKDRAFDYDLIDPVLPRRSVGIKLLDPTGKDKAWYVVDFGDPKNVQSRPRFSILARCNTPACMAQKDLSKSPAGQAWEIAKADCACDVKVPWHGHLPTDCKLDACNFTRNPGRVKTECCALKPEVEQCEKSSDKCETHGWLYCKSVCCQPSFRHNTCQRKFVPFNARCKPFKLQREHSHDNESLVI